MKRVYFIVMAFLFVTFVSAQNYTEISASQLPKKATEYLSKNLGSYTIRRAAVSTDQGTTKYAAVAETNGRKSIYVFDKEGNFLERVNSMKDISKSKPSAANKSNTNPPARTKPEPKSEPAPPAPKAKPAQPGSRPESQTSTQAKTSGSSKNNSSLNYEYITTSQLPPKVAEYLSKTLGTYSIRRAARTTGQGETKYAVVAQTKGRKSIYIFDREGNFLERVKNIKDAGRVKASTPPAKTGNTDSKGTKKSPTGTSGNQNNNQKNDPARK